MKNKGERKGGGEVVLRKGGAKTQRARETKQPANSQRTQTQIHRQIHTETQTQTHTMLCFP